MYSTTFFIRLFYVDRAPIMQMQLIFNVPTLVVCRLVYGKIID